ncbi:MAG: hypothetical protein A3K03_01755 [Bdellovibrionales bacterium RIFOXYD1_FULL_44_7]|nr:MAG: hypothetical protein A3K03_01755 [Bdellovibrionales bacterium RIFOXYD1_FULL_44_7]
MINFAKLPLLLLVLMALTNTARGDFYYKPWTNFRQPQRFWILHPDVSYYSTNSNYDTTGQRVKINGLVRYSRIQTDVGLAYGFNKYLTAFGRFSWARVQSENQSITGDSFGPTDQSVGLVAHVLEIKMGTRQAPISLDLQLQLDFPTYGNASAASSNSLFLGDGTTDFIAGTFVSWPFISTPEDSWNVSLGGGYMARTNGFSSAIPWATHIRHQPKDEGLIFEIGAFGISSFSTDSNISRISSTKRGNGAGGSYFVNAVNPSILVASGKLGYQFAPNIGLTVQGTQSIWGQSAPHGFTIGLGLQAFLTGSQLKNPSRMTPQDYGRSNQGFVHYSFEARVVRTNDRMNLVKIDKGRQDGVEMNQIFDVFSVKKDGTINEAIARAQATGVNTSESVLTITEYFKEVWIEEGFIVKRPLN